MSPGHPPCPAARKRVASVWIGVGVLVALVLVLYAVHAARTYALLHERAHDEARAAGTQAALQIGAQLRHVGDVVLHTKVAFDEFGPGLIERDPVTQARPAGTARPYRFIAILNATGDPTLVMPPGTEVPALPALAGELASRYDAQLTSHVHRAAGQQPLLLLVHRLVYVDDTYAGMVVGAVESSVVEHTLRSTSASPLVRVRMVDAERRDLFAAAPGGTASAEPDEVVGVMPVEGTPWQIVAEDDDAAVGVMATREMRGGALGSAFTVVLLLAGGVFVSRSLRREIDSDLRAQAAAAQAEVRTRFMAHMSHEIRTPIIGVLGASELLASMTLPDDQKRLAQVINTSGTSLLAIVNDLLDASRIDAGQLRVERIAFDAVRTVEDVVELFAPQAQAKGLEITQVVEPEVPGSLLGDPLRVRQVLSNLVSNAVKFSSSGEVVVRCGVDAAGATWWVRVDDDGIGISAADAERLFQPFEQVDPSMARRFGGTGLGLWIARGLAGLMGGDVGLQSAPGQGSQFLLRLPLQQAEAGAPSTPPAAALAGSRVLLLCAPGARQESLLKHLAAASVTTLLPSAQVLAALAGEAGVPDDGTADCDLMVLHASSFGLSPAAAWSALGRLTGAAGRQPGVLLLTHADELARHGHAPWPPGTAARLAAAPLRRAELWHALAALQPRPCADALEPAVPAASAGAPGPDRRRVLAAEDNEVNQLILVESLNRLGCDVHIAGDGRQAVQAFAPGRFALVLMDCQMPEMDGFDATLEIRHRELREGSAARVPIIALTAHAMDADRQRCLDAGMDDHLAKPYTLEQLKAVLQRWCAEPATLAATP